MAGNTHRAELSIDKLFDWQTPHGRQGLIELRAFEMPPHPRMVVAQMALVRALLTAFSAEPYSGKLVRWGQRLHDQLLLPHFLWSDLGDMLTFLRARGFDLEDAAYRPFLELRCPLVARLEREGVVLELRNALEPWPVLGDVLTATGTSRFVDSSMERSEVKVDGLLPERQLVLVNGARAAAQIHRQERGVPAGAPRDPSSHSRRCPRHLGAAFTRGLLVSCVASRRPRV